jgi:hypothetical protein
MTNVSRAVLSWVALLLTLAMGPTLTGMAPAFGERKKNARTSASPPATHGKANPCGCFKDTNGACFCGKKAKCGCPGECEPRGCAEKHDKDIEKEIRAETKRAQDIERKQKAASKRKDAASDPSPDGQPKPHPKTGESAAGRR